MPNAQPYEFTAEELKKRLNDPETNRRIRERGDREIQERIGKAFDKIDTDYKNGDKITVQAYRDANGVPRFDLDKLESAIGIHAVQTTTSAAAVPPAQASTQQPLLEPHRDFTPAEITAKQQQMDADMLKDYPGWNQRTSGEQARRELQIEHGNAYREQQEQIAEREKKLAENTVAGSRDHDRKAEASTANWAMRYEAHKNADGSVSYHRDGQEKIVDTGKSIAVLGDDQESMRYAVRLAQEKIGDNIEIHFADKAKEELAMKELARAGMTVANADLQDRFKEIQAEVARERAKDALSQPPPVQNETDAHKHTDTDAA